ncbi:MAG: 2OG-Fe(II) oxygenase [Proteobacteria bacterium]|nr:2OG-Fe(II) oxygenase [Pseudomonadota bacterium]
MSARSFEDAMGLLTRNGQPLDPVAGGRLLETLAHEGDARAAERLAVVSGAGFGRAVDWEAALRWLGAAAEGGYELARKQLRLLTGRSDLEDWNSASRSVDIDAWAGARPIRTVVGSPRVEVAASFMDAACCAWVMERAAPLQTAATVYNPSNAQGMQHDTRTNTVALFTIASLDVPTLLIRERISNTAGVPVTNLERFNVLRYLPGQRFADHVDFLDPAMFEREIAERGQRVATFLVYLNQDYQEGETSFSRIQKGFRGRTGDALLFRNVDAQGQPDRLTLHEGRPPVGGEKWLLSQFIRDKAQATG